jgi:lantibiotic modifying enzyme
MGVSSPSASSTLVSAAGRILETIVDTAIHDGKTCTWLASTVDVSSGVRQVCYATGNPNVYEGDAGIAWVLAYAGSVGKRDDLLDLARAAILNALSNVSSYAGGGLYDGAAGVAVAALRIAELTTDGELMNIGLDALERASASSGQASEIINGDAGILLALLRGHEITGDERLLQRAGVFGQSLFSSSYRRPWGVCWPTDSTDELGLCGLAHGASGIVWALAELDYAAGETSYHPLIGEALRYERSWFDREESNWPDLRSGAKTPDGDFSFPSWWCHGSTGIGSARLRIRELGHDDPIIWAEACAALQSSFAAAVRDLKNAGAAGHGLTVCHGLAGACDLFLNAFNVFGDPEHLATARWLLEYAIKLLGSDPESWPDGVGGRGGSAGLMTGLAGTLLVLLRAISPDDYPSVGLFPMA